MWIGFSKNLGGGFKVGSGVRLGGHRKRPTQAQLAKAEKKDFISGIRREAQSLIGQYLIAHNIDPQLSTSNDLDIQQILSLKGLESSINEISSTSEKIGETLQKVDYGSPLTSKKRSELVDLIFALRKLVPSTPSRLSELSDSLDRDRKKSVRNNYIACFLLAITIFLSPLALWPLMNIARSTRKMDKRYTAGAAAIMKEEHGI